MASPSFRAGVSWQDTAQAISIAGTLPAGMTTGDLMILSVVFKSGVGAINTPTGWTLVRKVEDVNVGAVGIFWKFWNGSETTATVSIATSTTSIVGRVSAFYGNAPLAVCSGDTESNNNAGSTSVDFAAGVADAADNAHIYAFGHYSVNDSQATSAPTGFEASVNNLNFGFTRGEAGLFYKLNGGATSIPSAAPSGGANGFSYAVTFGIRVTPIIIPAGGGIGLGFGLGSDAAHIDDRS